MTFHAVLDTRGGPLSSRLSLAWRALFLAVLAIPTAISLGQNIWSTETGAQGPIVLGTGIWLLWRIRPQLSEDARPGNLGIVAVMLLASLSAYVFGRAYDFLMAEAAGLYGAFLTVCYADFGHRNMLRNWFPFLYLGFVVPPPGYLIDRLTAPLKDFVSVVSTGMLDAAGLPIAREGVTIFVAQYQLLVEDACSGMNSIIGITAITMLYVYLMRGSSWRYSAVLLAFALPITIAANVVRICILILLTYYGGDSLAQGFLHSTAGIFLFAVALTMVFLLDVLLRRVAVRLGWAK